MHNRRTPNARERGYDSRWEKTRVRFLAKYPFCGDRPNGVPVGSKCFELGIVTAATVVDHVVPHRRDQALFWIAITGRPCALPAMVRNLARVSEMRTTKRPVPTPISGLSAEGLSHPWGGSARGRPSPRMQMNGDSKTPTVTQNLRTCRICGADLPAPAATGGRSRQTCSSRCKNQQDARARRVRRRERWAARLIAAGEVEIAVAVRAGNAAVADGRAVPVPAAVGSIERFRAQQRALRSRQR